MATPILATKLYIPPPRPRAVLRRRLIDRLNEGSRGKLTLISAPAGFGKTTLLSEWVAAVSWPIAWLSLDEGDNDPARFLSYFAAALQRIAAPVGESASNLLQSPQPPPAESILTALLNEIATVPDDFVFVLEDYHVIDAQPINQALTFLLEHLPRQMHLVIATREDPQVPLSRYRAQGHLTELRAADLRFTPSEASEFLNHSMGLHLAAQDITSLESRTEGWIAGLQLAAISLQGRQDVTGFIQSFTGSHHFVMDYLLEEVLHRQPTDVQTFLLQTSILDRLCGPLCDAVMRNASASGQRTLEYLEHASLFIVSLDDERRWYRYHHLFADLLRQRLRQQIAASTGNEQASLADLHGRASQWYEDNGLAFEAFRHAAAANDIDRAERLIEGDGIPRHLRGAVTTILHWLSTLPKEILDARPSLWWRYASLMLVNGQTTGVEEKLDAAEAALQNGPANDESRNLIGRISVARAVLALTRYQLETILVQSRRALEHLDANRLSPRATANWTLGVAYYFSGQRAAARQVLKQAISLSQEAEDVFTDLLATGSLGNVQEADNELHLAAESYQRALRLAGEQPLQILYDAHLGLARIFYEWNDLDTAEQHGLQSLQLASEYDKVIDRFIVCEVFLARLKLARGDVEGADAMLGKAEQAVRQHNFMLRMPEVAAARVVTLLGQGNLKAATQWAQTYNLPISQARVHLAQGDPPAALALLEPWRRQVEEKGWADEKLKALILEALAHQAHGEAERAARLLDEALVLAEPGGFIRSFIDEGSAMARLLSSVASHSIKTDYIRTLLVAFESEAPSRPADAALPASPDLIEPLSQRELEILRLIAQGLSNEQISKRLFLALSTVKGHNRSLFNKLQAQNRTEAVARARELDLL